MTGHARLREALADAAYWITLHRSRTPGRLRRYAHRHRAAVRAFGTFITSRAAPDATALLRELQKGTGR